MPVLFAFGGSPSDWAIVLIVGFVLFVIFGRRLPEVGRSLGKGITEFKKGMKGLEDETDTSYTSAPPQNPPTSLSEPPRPPQRITQAAPKFDENPNPSPPPRTT